MSAVVAFEALVTAAMAIFHEVRKRPVDQHAADESDALSTRAHNAELTGAALAPNPTARMMRHPVERLVSSRYG